MSLAACTLFEKDLHVGLGALANSLVAAGFRGTLWAGHRGPLPPWAATSIDDRGRTSMALPAGARIVFVALDTAHHFTHHKPWWMQRVLALDPEAAGVVYFDPDIVLKTDWAFVEGWVEGGLAVVEDILPEMGPTHPHREAWARLLSSIGVEVVRRPQRYVNGGFVGVRREHASALALWAAVAEAMVPEAGPLTDWRTGTRRKAIWSANQDGLNAVLMGTPHPVAILGPDAMDFAPGGWVMAHCIGDKPWRRDVLLEALRGSRPPVADVAWWNYADAPVAAVPPAEAARRRRELAVACMVVRFPYGLLFLPELLVRLILDRLARAFRHRDPS